MRIGLVTGEYPPMEGGVGAFTQEIGKAFAAQNHDVHIITSQSAVPLEEYPDRKPGEPYHLGFAQLYPFINRWRWPSLARVADLALRYEFDVLNVQYQAAAYNMKSAAINLLPWRLLHVLPVVVTFHDLRLPYLFPKANGLRRTVVNFMAKKAAGVIATNLEDYHSLAQLGIETPKLAQIPIGSNIEARPVANGEIKAVRKEFDLTAEDCLLGYFGFLNESKGADTLLEAVSKLPPKVHLAFIGGRSGSSDEANNEAFFQQLDELIVKLGIEDRVHWTGFVPAHHVSAYLASTDLMVMPYRDGVSLRRGTLMAALAHGRALITTKPSTETPELRHGDNIWFVPVDDVPALAEAIHFLLANADLRQRLGSGATAVADLFTWDKIAASTSDFFERVTAVD